MFETITVAQPNPTKRRKTQPMRNILKTKTNWFNHAKNISGNGWRRDSNHDATKQGKVTPRYHKQKGSHSGLYLHDCACPGPLRYRA